MLTEKRNAESPMNQMVSATTRRQNQRFRFSRAHINCSMTININWVSAHMLSCIATWWPLCLDGHLFRHWNDSCLTCRIPLWLREPSAQGFRLGGGVPSETPVLAGWKIHIFHSGKKVVSLGVLPLGVQPGKKKTYLPSHPPGDVPPMKPLFFRSENQHVTPMEPPQNPTTFLLIFSPENRASPTEVQASSPLLSKPYSHKYWRPN